MNQELVDRSLAYTEALRSHPIEPGMEFDHETLVALSTRMPQNKDIRALFPLVGGLPIDYVCEIQCDRCNLFKKTLLRKTQLIAYMECLRRIYEKTHKINCQTVATCEECKKAEIFASKQKQELKHREFIENRKKDFQNNTDFLIKYYLLVDAKPLDGCDWKTLATQMGRLVDVCDTSRLAEAINEMEYGEFLRTPYWKIVAYEVKRKNKFRCVMCDSSEHLQVHHKNYNFHGYEHTYNGVCSLTCVCNECHAKHHGHYE
jgi:hypothetical protein